MKIASLHIYPVKGMRAVALDSARVRPWGLEGDRCWAVVDEDGKVLTQREQSRLAAISAEPCAEGLALSAEGGGGVRVGFPVGGAPLSIRLFDETVQATPASAAVAEWLTQWLGTQCRLVHLAEPEHARPVRAVGGRAGETVSLADAYPVLLASTASLAALNEALGDGAVPMDRFRPNIVVEGCEPWEEERATLLAAGAVRFRGATPCERCIVTTVDQGSGTRPDKVEPLRTLARLRPALRKQAAFGLNLLPETEGVIAVGQRLEVTMRDRPWQPATGDRAPAHPGG